ncbi:hypothetical protein GXP67_32540 [Rhodocytophaga rosea]|uniref:Uncharacterized protein n=1 Tax=Rhodocytophaga rosea TaxID=2704465 RepID=A0A6C0GSR0_9BACT|nr:hypothetical protein [Rhodocytophaga rosea]QHT71046.1 hypothetical protein GXP67_32540 [Rhodocytophaga rosea]
MVRFFLFLCILLLSGYSQIFAHTAKESAFYSQTDNLTASEQVNSGIIQTDQTFVTKPSTSGTQQKPVTQFADIEVEEDESLSSRKYTEISYYVTSIFYARILEYFFRNLNKGFLFRKHISNISPLRWHLVIQVFRI